MQYILRPNIHQQFIWYVFVFATFLVWVCNWFLLVFTTAFQPLCKMILLFVFFTPARKELTTFLFPIRSCSSLLPLKIQSVRFPGIILSDVPFVAKNYNVWYNPELKREISKQICDKTDSLGAIISLITLIQTHSTSHLHGNRLILFSSSAHPAGTPCFTHFSPMYSTDIKYNTQDCFWHFITR